MFEERFTFRLHLDVVVPSAHGHSLPAFDTRLDSHHGSVTNLAYCIRLFRKTSTLIYPSHSSLCEDGY